MISQFQIVQQVDPYTSHPFRIIEVFVSSDGIRSRLCDGVYATIEEAKKALDARYAAIGK